ncbi:hypothetical protein N510_000683 [Firmicutes bacterium ASF500]|nr:hypothetical protein N510_000683 [Firmicutes bacterium ASF500]
MRIDQIALYNFGSYEGEAIFDTRTDEARTIILVGGKNGAGKTTLFTAMRICLYGYMSMGYKSPNAYYIRAIEKFLNHSAKLQRPTQAYVKIHISLSNGREPEHYLLTRAWMIEEALSETFSVEKNGVGMTADETADFEKYLFSLIPPELFDLYFFDGEKIADFFLDEGGSARIKNAFLTLCGYDVFDIMLKNFKRLYSGSNKATPDFDNYLEAKEASEQAHAKLQELSAQLQECDIEQVVCAADISALEKNYRQKGGVTQEEWTQKLLLQKEEEKKRDNWNALLKKWANELIPFLMIQDQVLSVKKQIEEETSNQKYRNFCEVLDTPEISKLLKQQLPALREIVQKQLKGGEPPLLNLSFEQSAVVLGQINQILNFDVGKVAKCKQAIKGSLASSAAVRQELENSSLSAVQEYMTKQVRLYERKTQLLEQKANLERLIPKQDKVVKQADEILSQKKAVLEEELKKASIHDISARAVIMLDQLQHSLYRHQVERVESIFRQEINILMRKKRFIDDIRIDEQFNIHIYRIEDLSTATLADALSANSPDQMRALLGDAAMEQLQKVTNTNDLDGMAFYCRCCKQDTLTLPIEIDKASLSNGEKQIFIMALYYSLVQLCGHEIPFIIDTPFARIDTEHRRNISQHFFRELRGQVFILSTNEEIDSDHLQILKDRIASVYLLENVQNKHTEVVKNSYFEVPNGF